MKHYDTIIVGGGAAGLTAAAYAAEQGKQALVLQALPKVGGNGIFAEEMFALHTKEQALRDIICDTDGWFRLAMEHSHWKNNARLTRNLLEKSGENMDWLCDHGLQVAGLRPESVPGLGAVTHFTEGMHTGREVMNVLRQFCEENPNVTIRTKTRCVSLRTDAHGRVIGVTAQTGGGEQDCSGDAVILSTGGCGGNRELIHRIVPGVDETAFAHLRGVRMNGDGIRMAEQAGAEICADGCFENAGPTFAGDQTVMGLVTKRYAVWLNMRGRRFANEAVGDNFVYGCNAVYAQPGHMCYVLLDQDMVEEAVRGPVDFLAGPEAVSGGMAGLRRALEKETEAGRVCVSNDLSAIARWMGISPSALEAELRDYNACCEAGRDPVFLKPQELLRPIRPGKYVCIRCGVDYILTHGGIRVDERLRVLRPDGSPIPGLYAAGVDISGLDSAGYQVTMGGHSLGLSLTGGRWAAACALDSDGE